MLLLLLVLLLTSSLLSSLSSSSFIIIVIMIIVIIVVIITIIVVIIVIPKSRHYHCYCQNRCLVWDFFCVCFRAQFHNLSNDRKNNLEIVHHMAMIKNQVGISLTLFFFVNTFLFFCRFCSLYSPFYCGTVQIYYIINKRCCRKSFLKFLYKY